MDPKQFWRFEEDRTNPHRVDDPLQPTPEELVALQAQHQAYNTLVSHLNFHQAVTASNQEREAVGSTSDITQTYGEIVSCKQEFNSLAEVLLTMKNRYRAHFEGGVFYDLGSVGLT